MEGRKGSKYEYSYPALPYPVLSCPALSLTFILHLSIYSFLFLFIYSFLILFFTLNLVVVVLVFGQVKSSQVDLYIRVSG